MQLRDIALIMLAVVIFGGNFVASKYALLHLPPFLYTALRFCLIALVLLPIITIPRNHWRMLLWYSVVATVHFSTGVGGLHYGLDVATNVIVSQLGVPIACLLGAVFLKESFGIWRAFGMAISFSGMILIAGTPHVGDHYGAFAIALIGALTGGVSSLMMKQMQGMRFFSLMTWMSILSAPQLLLLSYIFEARQSELLLTIPPEVSWSLVYTVLFSNLGALGIWFGMLRRYSVNQVAPFGLLTPFFGILFAQVFFEEALTWQLLMGGVLIIGGVAIITFRKPREAAYKELT